MGGGRITMARYERVRRAAGSSLPWDWGVGVDGCDQTCRQAGGSRASEQMTMASHGRAARRANWIEYPCSSTEKRITSSIQKRNL